MTEEGGTSDAENPLSIEFTPLPVEECIYRGEGNANLVVAVPSERKVIRFRKLPDDGRTETREDLIRTRRQTENQVKYMNRLVPVTFYYCKEPRSAVRHYDQADIDKLSRKIWSMRPEKRRGKKMDGRFAMVLPDYTFLQKPLFGHSNKPTFCVEIKPKQGILTKSDKQFKMCSYCLMQHHKMTQIKDEDEE